MKPAPGDVTLADLLHRHGFGSRREVRALIGAGRVTWEGALCTDPDRPVPLQRGRAFAVDGRPWPVQPTALVMLHKPAGTECSARPQAHPSVLTLLPEPLRRRGVQPVGRLDADTTGLLLLTDDGALNHRLTSPRHHVRKVYEVRCAHPVQASELHALREGVRLRDDPDHPVRALECEATAADALRLVIDEGRYHQVKRMVAAAGNRVTALHRSAFGPWTLPADLGPGQWRWLEPEAAAAGAPASPGTSPGSSPG